MKKMFSALGLVAGLCLSAEAYEDLTIAADEQLTISADSVYNSITVNGTLTIDNGAVVKVENESGGGVVSVGDGADATGTLNITGGAKLTANNNSGSKVFIGRNGGTGFLNVDGANLYTYNLYLGNDAAESTAQVTLSNGSVAYAQNSIQFGGYHGASASTPAEITVKSDARLKTWQYTVDGAASSYVHFRGGLIECWAIYNQGSGDFHLDGTSDYPIRTQFNTASKGDGTFHFAYYMVTAGNGGKIVFEGGCDWIKEGTGTSAQDLIPYAHRMDLSMKYTGRTVVQQGGFALRGADLLPTSSDLVLERGTVIDWGGNWQELRSVTGLGKIASRGQSDRLTLNVPADVTTRLSCAIDNPLTIVKTGVGTLEVLEDDLGNVTVSEGRLKMLCRADFGYDQYRFKIDSAYSPKYDAVHLSELYFYDGDDRVSTPYLETTQKKLFDDNYDDDHKWWISVRYDQETPTYFDSRHATVSYSDLKKITSYSWVTAGDSPGNWDNGRDPGSWRLMGAISGSSAFKTLSTVGHREYLMEKRHSETKKFVVAYPQPVCSNLTVSAKGTLELAAGVELSCKAVSVSCGDIVCGEGAKIVSASDRDQSLVLPAFDGGAFEKAGAGRMQVDGQFAGLDAIRVSGGTLAVDNGYVIANRYFRFVIESNRWMVAHATTAPSTTEQKTIQFGELGLYDRRGNRLNLSADGASTSGNASAGCLIDDDTVTSCYYTKLPTAYDFTVTLSEEKAAVGVVSYLFALETQWGGVLDKTPCTWKVYTKAESDDDWTLLDVKPNSAAASGTAGWKGWNGGVPWTFGEKVAPPRAAMDATTEITVDADATLDVSALGDATLFGAISVDLAGAGTVKGGKFAETGVLRVTGYGPGAGVTLPLTFVGTEAPDSFANWSVVVDGVVKSNWGVGFDGTKLSLVKPGTVLIVR